MAYPPSNGTMGHMWMDEWCFRCVHDHGFSHVKEEDPDKGCRIVLRMAIGDEDDIPELRDNHDGTERGWDPAKLECVMFERCPCQDDPGWEPPEVVPPDPNQGLLFEVLDDSPATPGGVIIPNPELSERPVEVIHSRHV